MKKTILTITLALATFVAVQAQTNTVATTTNQIRNLITTNEVSGKSYGGYELTLGIGGETLDGRSYHGVDVSLSTNPLEARPEVWVGVAQSLYWEPNFAGSTDLFVDWSQAVLPSLLNDKLYVNVGWSGGLIYDNESSTSSVWRSGPEVTFEYYTDGNAFFYLGANYDVYRSDDEEGEFSWKGGIGIAF